MIRRARLGWYARAAAEIHAASTPRRIAAADRIVERAQDDAPVVTGAYRGGMRVEVSGDDVTVVNDDPDAFFKEYGTIDTPPIAAMVESANDEGRYYGPQPR